LRLVGAVIVETRKQDEEPLPALVVVVRTKNLEAAKQPHAGFPESGLLVIG
jgi:hypothetical protein